MARIRRNRVITLSSGDILQFRLRKLTTEVANKVACRTEMFDPDRTLGNISATAEYFPMFLVTYMAIAWAAFIAHVIPEMDSEIYSNKYLDLSMDNELFLSLLAGHVIEENLLPEYRLGYLMALMKGCHMTEHIEGQQRLWQEFISQLSNLLMSMCAYTERGALLFEQYIIDHKTETL